MPVVGGRAYLISVGYAFAEVSRLRPADDGAGRGRVGATTGREEAALAVM